MHVARGGRRRAPRQGGGRAASLPRSGTEAAPQHVHTDAPVVEHQDARRWSRGPGAEGRARRDGGVAVVVVSSLPLLLPPPPPLVALLHTRRRADPNQVAAVNQGFQ